MNKIEIKVAKTDYEFVGITTKNNLMIIKFPIGYNISEETISTEDKEKIDKIKPDIQKLLKIMEKNNDYDDLEYFEDGANYFNFSSGDFLIKDFFRNGIFHERKIKQTELSNYNINWNATINNKTPIYYMGDYIYANTINNNVTLNENDITNIQLYCIKKALQILGIFYDNYHLSIRVKNNYTKEEMLYKIKKELNITNNDYQRKRLNMMKLFIEGTTLSAINEKEIKIGRYYFDKVWENHLRENITKKYKELHIHPTAYYIINNEKIKTSSLNPDIVIEHNNTIYILDAKYYKIGNLPQTEDINKQVYYAKYIDNEIRKPIKNIFLLPNNIETEEKYKFLGIGTEYGYEEENGSQIEVYYLDTKTIFFNPDLILSRIFKD